MTEDKIQLRKAENFQNLTWYTLIASFPISFYYFRQISKNPALAYKYRNRKRLSDWGPMALGFYGLY